MRGLDAHKMFEHDFQQHEHVKQSVCRSAKTQSCSHLEGCAQRDADARCMSLHMALSHGVFERIIRLCCDLALQPNEIFSAHVETVDGHGSLSNEDNKHAVIHPSLADLLRAIDDSSIISGADIASLNKSSTVAIQPFTSLHMTSSEFFTAQTLHIHSCKRDDQLLGRSRLSDKQDAQTRALT